MQVAEVLSDLASLQVCDRNAALALVSARPNGSGNEPISQSDKDNEGDEDLKRVKDFIALHSSFSTARQDGSDKELDDARAAVRKVLRTL